MPIPNWGGLQKSQDDDETIEQAIARIVQSHDDDPTAHLDTGQSLQSHKASDIIDHEAFSIINDKYADNSITLDKQLSFTRDRRSMSLESLDCWNYTNYCNLSAGSIFLQANGGLNAVATLNVKSENGPHFNKNFILQWLVNPFLYYQCEFYIYGGALTQNGAGSECVGFRTHDDKIYAFHQWSDGSAVHIVETEVTGIDTGIPSLLRIVNNPGENILFYVNGVLVATHSTNITFFNDSEYNICNISIKNLSSSVNGFDLRGVYFEQDF